MRTLADAIEAARLEFEAERAGKCDRLSRKNLRTGEDSHLCIRPAKFHCVSEAGHVMNVCGAHVKSFYRANAMRERTDRFLKREPRQPFYVITAI